MKNVYKYRYEIFASLLTLGLLTIILYLNVVKPENEPLRTALLISLVADAVLLCLTLRKLWKTKWKKQVASSVKKVFAKIAKAIMIFLEKWNTLIGDDKNVLSGKTTVSFDFSLQESRKQRIPKPLKWKQLKTDRERLRYLYRQMIIHKIDSGVSIRSSSTPLEIKEKCESDEFETELFEMYIDCRYDERKDISAQKISMLKSNID